MRTSDEIYEQYSLLCEEAEWSIVELMEQKRLTKIDFGDESPYVLLNGGFGDYDMRVTKIVLHKGLLYLYSDDEPIRISDLYKHQWIYLYDDVSVFLAK